MATADTTDDQTELRRALVEQAYREINLALAVALLKVELDCANTEIIDRTGATAAELRVAIAQLGDASPRIDRGDD